MLLLLSSGMVRVDAAVINYSGVCDTDCGRIGLSAGQSVSALFNLNPLGSEANLTLEKTDIISFSLDIGSIVFTSADTSNWDFEAATNALGEVVSFKFLASLGSPLTTSDLNDSVDLRTGSWFASPSGTCVQRPPNTSTATACDLSVTPIFGRTGALARGSTDLSPQLKLPTAVPEPTSMMLMAFALLALGLTWLRRRFAITSLVRAPAIA